MFILYTHDASKRFQYIVKTVLIDILNFSIEITDDFDKFKQSSKFKINYSTIYIEDAFNILPNGLLNADDIKIQPINVLLLNDIPSFFISADRCDIGFDIFSASFYLITRYEEYLPFTPDKHGRFQAEESLAYRNNFLNRPIVNEWALLLKDLLENKFKLSIKSEKSEYRFISTIDLDNIFAFKGKSLYRFCGGLAKDLLKFNLKNAFNRMAVLLRFRNDPFDHYHFHEKLKQNNNFELIYFIPFAFNGKYDVNVSPKSKAFIKLVKTLSKFAQIGVHPSYESNKNSYLLSIELNFYNKILNKKVEQSRQHFLMLNFPKTYRNLISNNIFSDYSMGYSTQNGFRASTCTTFCFFDLEKNLETNLKIFPFVVMDSVYADQLHKSIEESKLEIFNYIELVKKYNGIFISVWHDRTFDDNSKYKGWKNLYKLMVEEAINQKL